MVRTRLKLNGTDRTLKEGFKEFYLYQRIKNSTDKTLEYYEMCLYKFTKVVNEDISLKDITKATIDEFILFLKNSGVKDTTINNQLTGVRAMMYYFMKLGYMEEFKIPKVKETKELKQTYTEQEIKLLLDKPNLKSCSYCEYRNWVAVNILLGTGMRLSTLINLRLKDIDIENELIYYKHNKNRREQVIPISATLLKVLQNYIKLRLIHTTIDDRLLVSQYGEPMTSNSIQIALRKYNRSRGVLKTGIHLWRHTFAKMWILNGGDIFRLQKLLNHSSLDMVREYVNMFTDDLSKDFNSFNPLENLSKSNNKGKYIKMR